MQTIPDTSPMCDTDGGPGPTRAYEDALARGLFLIQQCNQCEGYIFYPRLVCIHCGTVDLRTVEPSGDAIVHSTTVVRQGSEDGGDYNVALVELAEGPRLMSRVENVAPERVVIGMKLRLSLKEEGGKTVVVFVPSEVRP